MVSWHKLHEDRFDLDGPTGRLRRGVSDSEVVLPSIANFLSQYSLGRVQSYREVLVDCRRRSVPDELPPNLRHSVSEHFCENGSRRNKERTGLGLVVAGALYVYESSLQLTLSFVTAATSHLQRSDPKNPN